MITMEEIRERILEMPERCSRQVKSGAMSIKGYMVIIECKYILIFGGRIMSSRGVASELCHPLVG